MRASTGMCFPDEGRAQTAHLCTHLHRRYAHRLRQGALVAASSGLPHSYCLASCSQLAGLMILELLVAPSTARQTSTGGLGMVEPAVIASKILEQRQAIVRSWAVEVAEGVPAALQALLVADLEADLAERPSSTEEGPEVDGDA